MQQSTSARIYTILPPISTNIAMWLLVIYSVMQCDGNSSKIDAFGETITSELMV